MNSDGDPGDAPIARLLGALERTFVLAGGRRFCDATFLEFFAREGDWHTLAYSSGIGKLHAWEINPDFEAALRSNLPYANVRIADSFNLANEPEFVAAIDVAVIDNPQGIFGASFCEHFEAVDAVFPLLRATSVLIFNVNFRPFDLDMWPEWRRRRDSYYGADASELSTIDFMDHYTALAEARGFRVAYASSELRDPSYLAYCALVLTRDS